MKRVIVTLRSKQNGAEMDIELPSDMSFGRISELIGDSLSTMATADNGKYRFYADDKLLDTNDTLASNGLWSGSIITFE